MAWISLIFTFISKDETATLHNFICDKQISERFIYACITTLVKNSSLQHSGDVNVGNQVCKLNNVFIDFIMKMCVCFDICHMSRYKVYSELLSILLAKISWKNCNGKSMYNYLSFDACLWIVQSGHFWHHPPTHLYFFNVVNWCSHTYGWSGRFFKIINAWKDW